MIINEIEYRSGRLKYFLDFNTGAKQAIKCCLKKNSIGEDDIVIVYSHNLWLHRTVQAYCQKRKIKVGAIVVEYFSCEQFTNKVNYKFYTILTRKVLPKYDFVFPISTYIEKKLSGGRAKQFVLPIMADPYEYDNEPKQIGSTRRFIFLAKDKMKDALRNTILAIKLVLQESAIDVEFHFCGVKEEIIKKNMGISSNVQLDKRIFIHGWLEYNELVSLYQKMHFLLLPRDTNEMTKANFPSKVPELMCYGVIPVASRIGDYTKFYLKDGKNSILMNGCSVEEIKNAIEKSILLNSMTISDLSIQAFETTKSKFWYKEWEDRIDSFMKGV